MKVVEEIARIKGKSFSHVGIQTAKNALRIFDLKDMDFYVGCDYDDPFIVHPPIDNVVEEEKQGELPPAAAAAANPAPPSPAEGASSRGAEEGKDKKQKEAEALPPPDPDEDCERCLVFTDLIERAAEIIQEQELLLQSRDQVATPKALKTKILLWKAHKTFHM